MAETRIIEINEEYAGKRIDRALAELCPEFSRTYVQELIDGGNVRISGKAVKASRKTEAGETVSLEVPDAKTPDIVPQEMDLSILYEDEDVLIVDKPKGLTVHPAPGHEDGTLVNGIVAHCGSDLSGINGVLRPGIVHRIDKDTSGALIICKNDRAHRSIAEQLKEHSITRRYRGVVIGNVPEDDGTIEGNIGRNPYDRKKMSIVKEGGKPARVDLSNREETMRIVDGLENAAFAVWDVKRSERTRKPPLPFTTSTLQQEASKVLNFSPQKTMRIAQQLYEGVEVKGQGTVALITYLRTDSVRISEEAQAAAAAFIGETYGEDYLQAQTREEKQTTKIQDAHEGIRPTEVTRLPAQIRESLSREQYRLYQLIWKRFVASRMSPARYETTQVRIQGTPAPAHKDMPVQIFSVSASRLLFDGFQKVYMEDEEEKTPSLGKGLDENSEISLDLFDPRQHYTQPAPHYNEASLVRALEEQGIGRPSTYAPTISTILARRYIVKEDKNLYMTELGEAVNDIMKKAFPTIVDLSFTANMEGLLDGIADGQVKWKTVIENFYPDLHEAVLQAEKDLEKIQIADEETEEICENCGRHMVIKYGPHGKFLACPGFPECHNTKPYYEKIGVACPKCGKDIIVRMSKKGRRYYGCMGNPECDFMVWQKPSAKRCPRCGGIMLEKGNRLVCADKECGYLEEQSEPANAFLEESTGE